MKTHDALDEMEAADPPVIEDAAKTRMILLTFVLFVLAAVCALYCSLARAGIPEELLDAIATVESGNDPDAVGDDGKALGAYQLWAPAVADANAWTGDDFTHEEMLDVEKARYVASAYLERWGAHYERKTGRPATNEVLSRIFNGGPSGWKKARTETYWRKVEGAMRKADDQ